MEFRNELFKAIPIFDSSLRNDEITSFSVKHKEGEGLVKYLYGFAEKDEEQGIMRTYIVRDNLTDELVGYFSLKAGMISINEVKIGNGSIFDTLPGVEVANFAINETYMKKHKSMEGSGLIIFNELILPLVYEASKLVGIKLIYLFSLPINKVIDRYKEYGFKRLSSKQEEELHKRLKPIYDEGCIFMYQEL